MMSAEQIEYAIKSARDCHTKAHWEEFYVLFGELLSTSATGKLVSAVFKKLESDPQSLYYNPKLWGALLQGSLACWETDTGIAAAEFSRKLTNPAVSIPASQVLLEGGKPAVCRDIAQRSLRVEGVTDLERIQLQLIVASSFAEEGKTDHAVRVLDKVGALVRTVEMPQRARADFVVQLGRMQYFMGRYPDAAVAFEEASPIMLELQDWDGAARALFNAGACIQNSGYDNAGAATALVERCRKVSEEHNLFGPISGCEAFYGVEAYSKGHFMSAREHFRRAMTILPANDKTFRRLHPMSFLSLTYFAMGRFALGIKFGRQTLELAALDSSERLKSRYQSLEAEILWEEGEIAESMKVLRASVRPLALHGIRVLEELSTLTSYQIRSAILGETSVETFKIEESLQKNKATWLEYLYSSALLKCSYEHFAESMAELRDCLERAKEIGSLNYQALILLAMIRLYLQKHDLESVQEWLPALETAVSRLGDTPIRAKLQIIYAAISYQSGDFEKSVKQLQSIEKMTAVSWPDRYSSQACLSTARGESPRFQHKWQEDLVARFVRGYFAPTIKFEALKDRKVGHFVISDHYIVNLEKHPAMADLLVYLSGQMPHGASLSDIQTEVWKESLNAQGWQQKIRNAVMRIRDLFPYTMAPVLVHNDTLRFFGEAIRVLRENEVADSVEIKVQRLLSVEPLSSHQLAEKMDVSLATAKRVLKKMTDGRQIQIEKIGRSVVYRNPSELSQ
jgi:tetratricopeptide (TPR) repeat protein